MPSHCIIIPVVDEPPEFFAEVLQRILRQTTEEVLVVINGSQNSTLEAVCEAASPGVRWTWTPVPDKREAEALGLALTNGEIVIFVDSDTLWTDTNEGTLRELLKPFADLKVGGVTTHQMVCNTSGNIISCFGAWIEAARWSFGVPSQSVFGQVGVLPGRTIAFRRSVLDACWREFLAQPVRISDDREQTMYTLAQGYRTVYQRTSVVETTMPATFRQLFRQQYRWAKGSQYNTVRWFGMMLRKAPFACYHFVADIITPFFLLGVLIDWARQHFASDAPPPPSVLDLSLPALIFLSVASCYISAAIRQFPRLLAQPGEWKRLPAYIVLGLVIIVPTRILGLLTAGWSWGSGWGTREGALCDQREIRQLPWHLRFGPTILGILLLTWSIFAGTLFRMMR
ncbi:glycosyltransferase [Verrucomicrobiota bacterium sgz303538]